jgi:hypothetical protein
LNQAFTQLIRDLSKSFSEPGTKLESDAGAQMGQIAKLAPLVWQAGACPEFRILPL